jgi:hypothetical protein
MRTPLLKVAIPKLLKLGDEYKIPFSLFLCGEVTENCRIFLRILGNY